MDDFLLNPVLLTPKDVLLVQMPYASLERPSIALSILKSALHNFGIDSSIIYGNILFAEAIGAHIYDVVNKSQSHTLAGEWTFANACFPDFKSNTQEYFDHTRFGLDSLQPIITKLGSHLTIMDVLEKIRTVTPGFIDYVARTVLQLNPKIVGCSSTFQQHCASLAFLKRIKELNPDVVTAIGGANCEATMGIVTHRECPWIDYVVSGEADLIFPQLVERILSGETMTLKDMPAGIIGPGHRDSLQYVMLELAPPRAKLKDMADSPAPDYDDYFTFLEYSTVGKFIKPGLLMETSRGCWWGAISHCTFCGLNGESMSHRSKDQERVFEEINALTSKYNLYSVEIVDNILEMGYFKSFIPKLAAQEVKYDIFYETKSNLNRDKLRSLSDAGIRWLQPGIESLDNTILKMIGKGTTDKINLQLMKWALEEGIYILWIMLYDLPCEEDSLYANMAKWLPCVTHLQPPSGLSFIQINRFSPYQMRPKDYNINLSPDRAYAYIYPWPEKSIADFAYYFDDYTRDRVKISYADQEPTSRPGLDDLKVIMSSWQSDWNYKLSTLHLGIDEQKKNLVFKEEDGGITIYDTRTCAVNEKHRLTGLEKEIFLFCDSFQTFNSIALKVKGINKAWDSEEEIRDTLNNLCGQKLLLNLDDHYFSLALRFPSRELPKRTNYPGGRLYSKIEVKNLELLKSAENSLLPF